MYLKSIEFKRTKDDAWESGYLIGTDKNQMGNILDRECNVVYESGKAYPYQYRRTDDLLLQVPDLAKEEVAKDAKIITTTEMKCFDEESAEPKKLAKVIDFVKNKETQKIALKLFSIASLAMQEYNKSGNAKTAILKAVSSIPDSELNESFSEVKDDDLK